jgi:dodecin
MFADIPGLLESSSTPYRSGIQSITDWIPLLAGFDLAGNDLPQQRWRLEQTGGDYYRIVSVDNGKPGKNKSARSIGHNQIIIGRRTMSIAKVTEIIASSPESFDDAVNEGIKRAGKTLENVRSAWVKELNVVIENGKITEYRVTMKVSFILKD